MVYHYYDTQLVCVSVKQRNSNLFFVQRDSEGLVSCRLNVNVFKSICQTFNEHLAGQKHRKKAAARALVEPTVTAVAGDAAASNVKMIPPATNMKVPKQSSPVIFCDLCNVSCCGPLVFAGHVQGTKHQKVSSHSLIIAGVSHDNVF